MASLLLKLRRSGLDLLTVLLAWSIGLAANAD